MEIGIMFQESNVRLWSHKLWPQNLRLYIRIRYEPLKNDKNIHIKGLKNDNFGDSIMSKFSTNDKWHIKNIINKKVVSGMAGWKYILKH